MFFVLAGWLLLASWWYSGHRRRPKNASHRFASHLRAIPTATPGRPRRGQAARRARRQSQVTRVLLVLVVVGGIAGLAERSALLGGILVTIALFLLCAYRIAAARTRTPAPTDRRQAAPSPRPRPRPNKPAVQAIVGPAAGATSPRWRSPPR